MSSARPLLLALVGVLLATGCNSSHEGGGGGGDAGRDTGAGDFDDCTGFGQCVLASPTCCGVCGIPTASDFDAVNESRLEAHREAVCPAPQPCPGCPSGLNPNLSAYCDVDTCRVLDARAHPSSECATDADCVITSPRCCDCVGAEWISLHAGRTGEYYGLVCDPAADCLPCAPPEPTGIEAFCAADGHCDLRPLGG